MTSSEDGREVSQDEPKGLRANEGRQLKPLSALRSNGTFGSLLLSLLLHAVFIFLLVWASRLPLGALPQTGQPSVAAYLLARPAPAPSAVPSPSQEQAPPREPEPVPKPIVEPVKDGERKAETQEKPQEPAPAAREPEAAAPAQAPVTPEAPVVERSDATGSEAEAAGPAETARSEEDGLLQRLRTRWLEPPNMQWHLACVVTIRIDASGQVLAVTVTETSGSVEFDDSVVRAIYKASPLPPLEQALAERGILRLKVSASALQ